MHPGGQVLGGGRQIGCMLGVLRLVPMIFWEIGGSLDIMWFKDFRQAIAAPSALTSGDMWSAVN